MNIFSGTWRPAGYTPWSPDRDRAYLIGITRFVLSCKPDKAPTLVINADVFPLKGGTPHWRGPFFHTFGRSDRRVAEAASLVEFFHAVAGMPLRDNPDWGRLTQEIRWKRLVGRVSRNGNFMNLLSIQTTDEFGEGLECFAWSTDGMCFPAGLSTLSLIPVEDFGSPSQGDESETFYEEDPVIPDIEDFPVSPGRPSVPVLPKPRKSIIQVADDDQDDGL